MVGGVEQILNSNEMYKAFHASKYIEAIDESICFWYCSFYTMTERKRVFSISHRLCPLLDFVGIASTSIMYRLARSPISLQQSERL